MNRPPDLPKPRRYDATYVIAYAVSAVAGLACIVVPSLLFGLTGPIPDSTLGIISEAVEQIRYRPSALLLFALGSFIGWQFPGRWFSLGFATITGCFIVAIIEMTLDPTSHNLWPIEFVIYTIYSVPGCAGALLGMRLKRRKLRSQDAK